MRRQPTLSISELEHLLAQTRTRLSKLQKQHEFLYWEIPAGGGQQAVRMGDWKGVRQNLTRGETKIELYNLKDDIGEKNDVAAANPEVVMRIAKLMLEQHVPAPLFPFKALDEPSK